MRPWTAEGDEGKNEKRRILLVELRGSHEPAFPNLQLPSGLFIVVVPWQEALAGKVKEE